MRAVVLVAGLVLAVWGAPIASADPIAPPEAPDADGVVFTDNSSIVDARPMRFPPEPIRSPGALIANHAIRRKDEFEDRGEDPNPLVDFVAKLPRRLGYNLGP